MIALATHTASCRRGSLWQVPLLTKFLLFVVAKTIEGSGGESLNIRSVSRSFTGRPDTAQPKTTLFEISAPIAQTPGRTFCR